LPQAVPTRLLEIGNTQVVGIPQCLDTLQVWELKCP
jgi:hypothetical protein